MEQNKIIELHRQSAITKSGNCPCSSKEVTTIDAEIEIEKDGKKLYISAQWADICDYELVFCVTRESLFQFRDADNLTDEDVQTINRIINDQVNCDLETDFHDQYNGLIDMLTTPTTDVVGFPLLESGALWEFGRSLSRSGDFQVGGFLLHRTGQSCLSVT